MERIKCEYLLYIEEINRYYCEKRCVFVDSARYCRACKKCDTCTNKGKNLCSNCIDHPQFVNNPVVSHYQAYIPACPFGYINCVYDPAYIKCYYPEDYEKEFGDCIPEEVVKEDIYGCYDYFKDERYDYCPHYDDEDK